MHVLIIGSGLAGLSAAQRLLDHQCQITLIEKKSLSGGRVFSFADDGVLSWFDNGPHVLMKCNPSIRQYLQRLYAKDVFHESDLLRPVNNILYAENERTWELNSGKALLNPFLFASFPWTWKEKIHLLKTLHRIRRNRLITDAIEYQSVSQVLKKWNQSSASIRYFWEPLCLAVMNAHPDTADARMFIRTFYTMISDKERMMLLVPRVSLQDLLVKPAIQQFLDRGAEIVYNQPVTEFRVSGDRIVGVQLKNGRLLCADAYISTLPPWDLIQICDNAMTQKIQGAMDFSEAPIISAYIRCDAIARRYQMNYPAIACIGQMIQWLFIRDDGMIGAVISAAYPWIHRSIQDLAHLIQEDCKNIFGAALAGKCKVIRIIKMRRATAALCPEKINHRPGVHTSFRNFFIAGDWTATGLPCTMESAVLSGFRAADAIIHNR